MNAYTHPKAMQTNLAHTQTPPIYNARDLTKEGISAMIVLDGQIYTLRITRAGKLILTK